MKWASTQKWKRHERRMCHFTRMFNLYRKTSLRVLEVLPGFIIVGHNLKNNSNCFPYCFNFKFSSLLFFISTFWSMFSSDFLIVCNVRRLIVIIPKEIQTSILILVIFIITFWPMCSSIFHTVWNSEMSHCHYFKFIFRIVSLSLLFLSLNFGQYIFQPSSLSEVLTRVIVFIPQFIQTSIPILVVFITLFWPRWIWDHSLSLFQKFLKLVFSFSLFYHYNVFFSLPHNVKFWDHSFQKLFRLVSLSWFLLIYFWLVVPSLLTEILRWIFVVVLEFIYLEFTYIFSSLYFGQILTIFL